MNAPDPLYAAVSVDDESYSVVDRAPAFHCQKLDFRYGLSPEEDLVQGGRAGRHRARGAFREHGRRAPARHVLYGEGEHRGKDSRSNRD